MNFTDGIYVMYHIYINNIYIYNIIRLHVYITINHIHSFIHSFNHSFWRLDILNIHVSVSFIYTIILGRGFRIPCDVRHEKQKSNTL